MFDTSEPARPDNTKIKDPHHGKGHRRGWYILLVLPYLGLLWPALYSRHEPELFGFPFFYWYQFAWVIVSAILTGITYLMTTRR